MFEEEKESNKTKLQGKLNELTDLVQDVRGYYM